MAKQLDMFTAPTAAAHSMTEAIGCRFNHKGTEGTITAYDVDTYAEPMLIVQFDSGRTGVLKPSELGAS